MPEECFRAQSGLHQNWMRDYDPTTGRYIQADPLGLVDGASVYNYTLQNPERYIDWTGLANNSSTIGGDDPGFHDPNIVNDLKKKLKDPSTSQKEKSEIKKRLKELTRKKSGSGAHQFCGGSCIEELVIGAGAVGAVCACVLFPEICVPALIIGGGAAAATN